jgi:NTE family protein
MVGFVLSGGGSLGAIQVGMLRALYEREIAPELVVGTSAGALNGGYIVSRPPTVETTDGLARIWRSLRMFGVFTPNPMTAVLALLGQRDHFVPDNRLKALVKEYVQIARIEDAAIPFHVVATDALTGRARCISAGDAERAILASSAIPGLFPAIEFEEDLLVDGGVSNNCPVSDAADLGATRIYVLPAGMPCELQAPPGTAIAMLVHAITLLINQRLVEDIRRVSDRAELIVIPPPCPLDVLASDFSHADKLIHYGYELGQMALDHPDPAGHWTPRSLERLQPHEH